MKPRVSHTTRTSAFPALLGQRLRDVVLHDDNDEFDFVSESHPDTIFRRRVKIFDAIVGDGLSHAINEVEDGVRRLTGRGSRRLPERLLLSNHRVRRRAYNALYNVLRDVFRGPVGTRRRWFFGTFIDDVGNSLERAPVIEVERLRNKCRKAMNQMQLHGLAFIEIQGAQYPQRGRGHTLMAHVHFFGYSDDPAFCPRTAQRLVRAKHFLSNWLGAPTVVLKPISTLSSLQRRCGYVFKPPVMGKRLVPDAGKRTGYKCFNSTVSASLALRLVEVLAQIDLSQACFATGGGCTLRQQLLSDMRTWHRRQRVVRADDPQQLFQRLWDAPRYKSRRLPAELHFTPGCQSSDAWYTAMQLLMREVVTNREGHAARRQMRRARPSRTEGYTLL